MKKAILLSVLFTCPSVIAATHSPSGEVSLLRSHDSRIENDIDWFSLKGVSSIGSCKKSGEEVVLRLKDDERGNRQYSMLLAAKMASAEIVVAVDDLVVDSLGYCYVASITLK